MTEFVIPKTDSKTQGPVTLEYAFQLRAAFAPARVSRTHYGRRLYQAISSGNVVGGRLRASVHPGSGGHYDIVRPDGVRELYSVSMVRAEDGQWIYVEHMGYRRPDGYHKAIAYLEADENGPNDWLNNTTFAVTAEDSPGGRETVFTYYVAN